MDHKDSVLESVLQKYCARAHTGYGKYRKTLDRKDLSFLEDVFVTKSGRRVNLEIYSEAHNIEQCHYAMDALKRSMKWDEERFGREYDLDIFMIVAVEDFNMGAMENKKQQF